MIGQITLKVINIQSQLGCGLWLSQAILTHIPVTVFLQKSVQMMGIICLVIILSNVTETAYSKPPFLTRWRFPSGLSMIPKELVRTILHFTLPSHPDTQCAAATPSCLTINPSEGITVSHIPWFRPCTIECCSLEGHGLTCSVTCSIGLRGHLTPSL